MAKLKAPLLSLGASGQLGKALVYFGWKGLDVVREYVVPSNPQTALQQTQRGYVTAAVAAVHAAQGEAVNPLDSVDITAYALWASVVKSATTWFNQVVKMWLDVMRAGDVPVIYRDGDTSNTLTTSIYAIAYFTEETGAQLAAGKFYFGISKTALVNSTAATISPSSHAYVNNTDLSAFLTAGNKYFWQFRPDSGDPCVGADSGIYHFVAT